MTEQDNKQITSDQAFYDNEPIGSLADHAKWMHEIEFYFEAYAARLDNGLAGTNGYVAELGAGSCGLSVCLTRLPNVKRVTSLDISSKRMSNMIDQSVSVLGGNKTKIMPVACDFNSALPFSDEELDAILFDAALHHTRSMWNTLAECNRVLKKGGLLIAQRESYLSPFRAHRQLYKLLDTPEIAAKVSENMYLLEQYKYYLSVTGFNAEFMGVGRGPLKKLLSIANGSALFADGILFCDKL
jgi:ubiquinone/menaquinone biosynthesis C-methylase UbiE